MRLIFKVMKRKPFLLSSRDEFLKTTTQHWSEKSVYKAHNQGVLVMSHNNDEDIVKRYQDRGSMMVYVNNFSKFFSFAEVLSFKIC